MNKQRILDEIRRTAADNDGVPLGYGRFETVTGIAPHIWRGKFWRGWGEALKEAGFAPNALNLAVGPKVLVTHLAKLTRENRRFPTDTDITFAKTNGVGIPHPETFRKLGSPAKRIELVRKFAQKHAEYRDILAYLPENDGEAETETVEAQSPAGRDGAVYMLKLGKHYKIGKSFRVPQRHKEIGIELPEKPDVIHVITTDDPTGIEAYWHGRFAEKRTNGEWFALARVDIAAFKRRKFM